MISLNDKKISVCVCTYNGEKFLREQLDSVLTQTAPLYEIVIHDDCSTDNTYKIACEYQQKHPQLVRCVQNAENQGWKANFLTAMNSCKGDYIALCDQDDIWLPNKIETMFSLIDNKLMLVANSMKINEDNTEKLGTLYGGRTPDDFDFDSIFWRKTVVFAHSCMISSSLLPFLNNSFDKVFALDHSIALICSSKNSVVYCNDCLQLWRQHTKSATHFAGQGIGHISGLQKTIKAISMLCSAKKIEEVSYFFDYILNLFNTDTLKKNSEYYKKLCSLMSRQTLFSYLRASALLKNDKKNSLKQLYLRVTFVFRWYYDFLLFDAPNKLK